METLINSYIAAFAGLMLLSYCADTLVESSIIIAQRFKLSKVFIGSAIIGFGSSLPEVMSTVTATLNNQSDLAVSTVIGSNIANIGIPLALCLLISKNWPDMRKHKFELGFVIISYAIFLISAYVGFINQIQGALMIILLMIFLIISLKVNKETDQSVELEVGEEKAKKSNILELSLGVFVGLFGLAVGADLLINGATSIAESIGVSEKIIGLTLVALGTSLPETAASIAAARKGETGLVLGNIVGSNVFNILAALGIAAVFNPLEINNFGTDSIFLVIMAVLLIPFFFSKKGLNKVYGFALLIAYATYLFMVVA